MNDFYQVMHALSVFFAPALAMWVKHILDKKRLERHEESIVQKLNGKGDHHG